VPSVTAGLAVVVIVGLAFVLLRVKAIEAAPPALAVTL